MKRPFLPLVSGQRYAYLGYGCLSCLAQTLLLVMEDLAGRLGDFIAWIFFTSRGDEGGHISRKTSVEPYWLSVCVVGRQTSNYSVCAPRFTNCLTSHLLSSSLPPH